MTTKPKAFDQGYFYPPNGDQKPYLHLGYVYDVELANMIVTAIRNFALTTVDARLVEYALTTLLEFKKWKDLWVAEEEENSKIAPAPDSPPAGPYL